MRHIDTASKGSPHSGHGYPLGIIPFYIAYFASNTLYQGYFTLYLHERGYAQAVIGVIMALSPLAAFIGQPIWGRVGDRARYKRTLLMVLAFLSAGVMLFIGSIQSVWYVGAMVAAYAFFQTSLNPLADTIALEELDRTGKPFGPARLSGALAYAVCSVGAGWALGRSIEPVVPITSALLVVAGLTALLMPKVRGHMARGVKAPLRDVLKNRELLLVTAHTMALMVTMSFAFTFFPIFFQEELGATRAMLGWANALSALCEIPFLIFADRLFKRFGVKKLLMAASLFMCVRWVVLSLVGNPWLALASQALHGGGFIVMTFAMVKYVNIVMPNPLKATGQMLLNVVGLGVARVLGTLMGGFIADAWGTRTLFMVGAVIALAAFAIFGIAGKGGAGERGEGGVKNDGGLRRPLFCKKVDKKLYPAEADGFFH